MEYTLNLVFDVAIFRNPGVFKKSVNKKGHMALKCLICNETVQDVENLVNVVTHLNTPRHKHVSELEVRKTKMFKL